MIGTSPRGWPFSVVMEIRFREESSAHCPTTTYFEMPLQVEWDLNGYLDGCSERQVRAEKLGGSLLGSFAMRSEPSLCCLVSQVL